MLGTSCIKPCNQHDIQAALFNSARPYFTCKRKHETRLHSACAVLHTETADRFKRGSKMSWISGNVNRNNINTSM